MSQVLDTPPLSTPPPSQVTQAGDELTALAVRYGLSVSGARPTLRTYVSQLWARRHFITAFATAKLTAQYSQAKLGQIWQVMTPLLNAAVYYFIFGVLLGTKQHVPDYIPFLVTGVFIWTFTQSSIMAGTRAIAGNLGLVRALHFPRAALPISFCIQQLQQLLFSMAALIVILLCFGIPVTASWLLVIPALALQFVFNAGVSMIMARMGASTPRRPADAVRAAYLDVCVRGHVEPRQAVQEGPPAARGVADAGEQPGGDLHRPHALRAHRHLPPPSQLPAPRLGCSPPAGRCSPAPAASCYFWQAEETYGRG